MKRFTCKLLMMLTLQILTVGNMTATNTTGCQRIRKTLPKTMKAIADKTMAKAQGSSTSTISFAEAIPQRRAARANTEWETLLSEDFSLFTKGSEDAHDDVMYPKNYFNDYSYILPDSLFHTPGWTGIGLYEAGGKVALAYPNIGGLLNTSTCNMNGRIRVKLRAKAVGGNVLFFMSVLYGGYVNPQDPIGGQMNKFNLKPSDGWKDLELTLDNPYTGDDAMIQVNAMAYNTGALVIDEITVERDKSHISTPAGLTATKFTYDGFTAGWNKAYGADKYLVNLYELKTIGTQNVVSKVSFEDNEITGSTLSGLPTGWTAMLDKDESAKIMDNGGYNSDKYLQLSGADTLVYDVDNRLLKNVRFALRRIESAKNDPGAIKIGFLIGSEWRTYSIKMTDKEWQYYDLANSSSFRGFHMENVSKFRIYGNNLQIGSSSYGIDDLECETTPERATTCIQKDIETSELSAAFSGLDFTNNDYYFTVTGKSEDGRVSETSAPQYAFGVAAPHVKEPTDIDKRGAFTANWEVAPNATSYILRTYEIYTCPKDMDGYTVFEENFDKCTEGTEDKAKFLGNYENMSLDSYCDNAGWNGTGTLVAPGMVGCYEDESGITYFDLQSPEISVGHGDGNYEVEVTFSIQNDGETLCVQGDNSCVQGLQCDKAGDHTGIVNLTSGTNNTHLLFYTLNNTPFLLNKVVVRQNVKKGDQFFTQIGNVQLPGDETSARISGIDIKDDYSYAYCLSSIYNRYGNTYYSDRSDYQAVEFAASSAINLTKAEASDGGKATYFDLCGRVVEQPAHGVYIIKQGDCVRKVVIK